MRQHNRNKYFSQGGALISALFITAIAAIIAVALIVQQRLLIHEGGLIISSDQSYLNLQSLQIVAENEVIKYASQWTNTKNPPAQFIPLETTLPKIKLNNMVLTGTLDDEQGKFNIDELVYTANQPQFVALLKAVVQGISQQIATNIAQAITIWMTNNSQDPYYLSLNPAYRAPETEMANISELRLVNGVTPQIFSALEPYITALPIAPPASQQAQNPNVETTNNVTNEPVNPAAPANPANPTAPTNPTAAANTTETPININSASAPVFLTMNPTLTLSQAESLVICRKKYGVFADTNTFLQNCAQPAGITTLNNMTASSQYFLVKEQADYDHHLVQLNSLMVTQPQKNNTLKIVIVWQEFE